jgi:hypothetical protein
MNVFSDEHNDALFQFLRILFERRLGWNLYRPIGYEWYRNLCWRYSDNPATVDQYLKIPNDAEFKDGIYYIKERRHNEVDKCITFDKFKEMKIDIMIASVVNHELPYHTLCGLHFNHPKLIRVIGNWGESIDFELSKNIIATAKTVPIPQGINVVFCHQEFDLNLFSYKPPAVRNSIKNFMNCLPDSKDFPMWGLYKSLLPDFDWKMHGILGEDGIIGNVNDMVPAMQNSTFIWHVKYGGDGFGHVVHNAYACGRPLITKGSYYTDKLAGALMIDGETCIDLEKHTTEENVKLIREFSQPEKHNQMCENSYKRFKEVVDYDKEFEDIKKFLERLQ